MFFKKKVLNEAPFPSADPAAAQKVGANQTEFKQTMNTQLDTNTNPTDNSQVDASQLVADPTQKYGAVQDPNVPLGQDSLQDIQQTLPQVTIHPDDAKDLRNLHHNVKKLMQNIYNIADDALDVQLVVMDVKNKMLLANIRKEVFKTKRQLQQVLDLQFVPANFDKIKELYDILYKKVDKIVQDYETTTVAINININGGKFKTDDEEIAEKEQKLESDKTEKKVEPDKKQ